MTMVEIALRRYEQDEQSLFNLHEALADMLKRIVQPYAELSGYERWPLHSFEIDWEIDGSNILITPISNRSIGYMPPFRVPKSFLYATDEIRQGMLDGLRRQKDETNERLRQVEERTERELLERLIAKYGVPE
jgi:hypothetical protein